MNYTLLSSEDPLLEKLNPKLISYIWLSVRCSHNGLSAVSEVFHPCHQDESGESGEFGEFAEFAESAKILANKLITHCHPLGVNRHNIPTVAKLMMKSA